MSRILRRVDLGERAFELVTGKLTLDVLAHLRAVAQGIAPADASRLYLQAGHDGSAMRLHHEAVALAAAVAKRSGMGARWRLLRLPALATPAPAGTISLEEWSERHGYSDWSFEEIKRIYEGRHGPLLCGRKQAQIERLTRKRLALIEELVWHAVPSPTIADPVAHWFNDETARRLLDAGYVTLGQLRTAIAQGGRWWRYIYAFGPRKAAALATQVALLVGKEGPPTWRADANARRLASQVRPALASWLNARTQSDETARAYRREVERFAIWLAVERDISFEAIGADECSVYIAFLRGVPPEWISRQRVRRYAAGCAPFFGQPSISSQRHALTVLSAFYGWLVSSGRLIANPWSLANTRLPDARSAKPARSHAFTPQQWALLLARADALAEPAGSRMAWLLRFALATGLRPAELLAATRGDAFVQDGYWWLRVHGKGARNRAVPIPSSALVATRAYFAARGLRFDSADPAVPLLAPLGASSVSRQRVPYSTLADYFKRFVAAAVRFSDLSPESARQAEHASLHWLRHTHATRAVEAGVSPDVLQANLGHANPSTTALYYRAQEQRRMAAME